MKKILIVVAILAAIGAGVGAWAYPRIYGENVRIPEGVTHLYVPTGTNHQGLVEQLNPWLKNTESFKWVADLKKFDRVRPGRYALQAGWSNNDLVNCLRSGAQDPVKVTFTPTRYLEDVAGKAARHLEADSTALIAAMTHPDSAARYGFNERTFSCMFIPNTYEFYWNTDVAAFLDRMGEEYKKFWNNGRRETAQKLGLTPEEVVTLASIVQEEIAHVDEAPRVAGVYLNRIRDGWSLDADPTLKFANNDWSIRRVLDKHKAIDSPYNTYKYRGIPPGPIALPSSRMIDAVLNAEKHGYYFFVANANGNGYHHFSKSLREHIRHANQYHAHLDRRGIR